MLNISRQIFFQLESFGECMLEKIFIIEDDEDIQDGLSFILKDEGYKVFAYSNGMDALKDINILKPDLFIVDVMLPDIEGTKLCKNFKSNKSTEMNPVIMLSSKSQEQDIIDGFASGCDDYITKPFSEKILLAKIKLALLNLKKNDKENSCSIINVEDMIIDFNSYEVLIHGEFIDLTPAELKVLYYLVLNRGNIMSREQIIDFISAKPNVGKVYGNRSIDILITKIRKKIGNYSKYIESIYGVGYRFCKKGKF